MNRFDRDPRIETAEPEDRFIRKMSQHLLHDNEIDNSLYGKYDYVKRGLRDANGAGVVVGLTRVGDVEGYAINEKGERVAIPGKLYYRGIDVEDLFRHCVQEDRFGYEETSYLLLFGSLPTPQQLEEYKEILGRKRDLPDGFTRDTILIKPSRSIMNKLGRSILSLYCYDPNPDDTSIENVLRQSISLIGYFPSLIAYGYQAKRNYYDNKSLHIHYPDPTKSTAENILRMLRPHKEYSDIEAKILDLCLILHAEHGGGNNSSFATRLVTSSGTDTYSAIATAVCSLKGPKHGGANSKVINMIRDIKENVKDITDEKEVEQYLIKILNGEANDHSGLIYGLGHAVYTISDPRATLLKSMARKLAEATDMMEDFMLYDFIEKRGPSLFCEVKGVDRPMPANVDLYSGFVYHALNIPLETATPLFAASRISGWCAHRIEELIMGGKIMRPAYQTIQSPLPYISLDQRAVSTSSFSGPEEADNQAVNMKTHVFPECKPLKHIGG